VLSLPGQISTNDVADVMTALHSTFDLTIDPSREALSLDTRLCRLVDQQKVSIVGGSHGGFIAGHCIGQHPGVFKVAAMRNPVTNIPAMVACSDIAGS
jgi:acylaminoacyl-peptidase